jgi:hypothetical protein
VWLCQSAVNGREQQVVLKLVDTRERAMEEARILKQLRGVPSVAQLLDVIHHSPPNGPSRLGLVMEYYPSSGNSSLHLLLHDVAADLRCAATLKMIGLAPRS